MTSIEVPYSIAAALPTLSVMDITNEVSREVSRSGRREGLAYIHAGDERSLIRVQERETGFFEDVECLLERIVPADASSRSRLVGALLGPGPSRCRSRTALCASVSGSACSSSRWTRPAGDGPRRSSAPERRVSVTAPWCLTPAGG